MKNIIVGMYLTIFILFAGFVIQVSHALDTVKTGQRICIGAEIVKK